jgi:hypothetical protein
MRLDQAIIEALQKLLLQDSVVQRLPKKVIHPISCLIKQFPFILGETNVCSSDLVGLSYGEILLEELLWHLSPQSDHVGFQGIKPIFGFILE